MKIVSDFNKNEDFIEIDYTPFTICNQKCSYCFVRSDEWGKKFDKDAFNSFKQFLKKQKYKIKLNILGGEPTLLQNFDRFIIELDEICDIITLHTNGTHPDKLINIPDNIDITITPHYEYINDLYIKKINNMLEKSTRSYDFNYILKYGIDGSRLNIMKKSWHDNFKLYENSNIILTSEICGCQNKQMSPSDMLKMFDIPTAKSFTQENYYINDKLFSSKAVDDYFNSFNYKCENWLCSLNYFLAKVDGSIVDGCYQNILGNYKNELIILEPIKHMCKLKTCSECLVGVPKIIPLKARDGFKKQFKL